MAYLNSNVLPGLGLCACVCKQRLVNVNSQQPSSLNVQKFLLSKGAYFPALEIKELKIIRTPLCKSPGFLIALITINTF